MTSHEKYVEACKTRFWREVFRVELEYLVRHLEGSRDVLSVGCGPAIIEAGLAERGFRVTGLDVSQEALHCAADRVRTIVARAEDMPFAESSFDAVVYVASLQFVEDYSKAIEQTARVLRPDGRLIALLLNLESDFFRKKLRNPLSYVHKIRHTDLREIEDVMAADYTVQTEYLLGVKDDTLFESRDAADAVLYVIRGTHRQPGKDDHA
jgi:ubiquinone/menaquinone biosynthesis C-methylase UbiE